MSNHKIDFLKKHPERTTSQQELELTIKQGIENKNAGILACNIIQ